MAGPCVGARAQTEPETAENGSVRPIFLLFLEGEFIFHILKGVCDHVATKSFFPGNPISIFLSNKAHVWVPVSPPLISLRPDTLRIPDFMPATEML